LHNINVINGTYCINSKRAADTTPHKVCASGQISFGSDFMTRQ